MQEWDIETGSYIRLPHGYVSDTAFGRPMALLTRRGRHVNGVAPVLLTGWSAGPGMWFRSMERRVAIARQRLMAEAERLEEREYRAAQARWQAMLEIRRRRQG